MKMGTYLASLVVPLTLGEAAVMRIRHFVEWKKYRLPAINRALGRVIFIDKPQLWISGVYFGLVFTQAICSQA